jgi:hypothetical protein
MAIPVISVQNITSLKVVAIGAIAICHGDLIQYERNSASAVDL